MIEKRLSREQIENKFGNVNHVIISAAHRARQLNEHKELIPPKYRDKLTSFVIMDILNKDCKIVKREK